MSPWEALGLTREAAADPATVKRAYARLLKEHRPDRDPEGFRRIRDAYEILTGPMARWITAAPDPGPAVGPVVESAPEPVPEPAVAGDVGDRTPTPRDGTPVPATPDPTDAAWSALAAAAAASADQSDAGLAQHIGAVLALASAPAVLAGTDGRLAGLLKDRPAALLAACTDAWLLQAAAVGGGGSLLLAVGALAVQDDPRLDVLLKLALASPGLADHGELLVRLAGAAAIDRPQAARKLSNAAFAALPGHLRFLVDRIEWRIRVGGELSSWPAQLRQQLVAALDNGEMPPELHARIKGRLGLLSQSSAVRHAVYQAFPDLRSAPVKWVTRQRPVPRSSSSGFRYGWLIIVVLLVVGRCAATFSDSSPPHASRQRQEMDARFEEMRRQFANQPYLQPPTRTAPAPPSTGVDMPLVLDAMRRLAVAKAEERPAMVHRYLQGDVTGIIADDVNHRALLERMVLYDQLDEKIRIAAVNRLASCPEHPELQRLRGHSLTPRLDAEVRVAETLASLRVGRRSSSATLPAAIPILAEDPGGGARLGVPLQPIPIQPVPATAADPLP